MDRPPAAIKAVVIGLGLAIVGLSAILIFGVVDRMGDRSAGGADARGGDFADVAVALPAGARISAMAIEDGALSLLLDLPSGAQTVATVDRRTGETLGLLELLPRGD